MNAFDFGQFVGTRVKKADGYDNFYNTVSNSGHLLNDSFQNSTRAFKGLTGSIGAGLGAAGAGIVGAGMQAANLPSQAYNAAAKGVNSMTGQQTLPKAPQAFSPETVNTAYGTAKNYGNVAMGYGRDFANSMGLGPEGLNGVRNFEQEHGTDAWNQVHNAPGVTRGAKLMSNIGYGALNTASHVAPAAAIGSVAHAVGHAANAAPAVTNTGRALQTAARSVRPMTSTVERLTDHLNPTGFAGRLSYDMSNAPSAAFAGAAGHAH